MSQLNVDTIKKADGTGNLSVPAETGTVVTTASPSLGRRNMILNGAMTVWQRGTSADTATAGDYMSDRWRIGHGGLDGNVDWDQETASTPDGFGYALKVSTDASETSLDAGDTLFIQQRFEGQDLQQLQKGTAEAKSLTVSFWVKSSVASTYTVELYDNDNVRSISKSYAINTADTWEFKTLTFEGDTTGAFDNDNAYSLQLGIWIDAGSNFTSGTFNTSWQANTNSERVYGTTGWLESTTPTFYITGVQLEVGSVASTYEHRSYGEELALCKRYYRVLGKGLQGDVAGSTFFELSTTFDIEMRSAPDLVLLTSTPSITEMGAGGRTGSGSVISGSTSSADGVVVAINGFSGMTVSNGAYSTTASLISCSAEL